MLNIGLITLFPEMFETLKHSITGKILDKPLAELHFFNPRDYTDDKHRTVDDKPYGGGPGMLMKVEPLRKAITAAKTSLGEQAKVIYLSPQGEPFTQGVAQKMSKSGPWILLCGRYEGIDARLLKTDIDAELSIGDFVLTGGEIPAMAVIDACLRLMPGALGDNTSAEQDSFCQGLLEYPHYTRPEKLADQGVPDVLLRGNHGAIARWREKQALGMTWLKRPDLLDKLTLSKEQTTLLNEFIDEQGKQ
ncbi:MAG: tRNA (guanosine(37)-N1)-methyltransferase TrmD [Gammaproteobacteria bacterium CG11_big_fil_rev_8_21_14_0_20_46_22]|nr:MAG: tRNA (guanosine(37)-N1)-methyltransferase TrmD [Gammaproteobacteria bacterium CG12_big_fil_rev_8_21_14_0_65_46_12]PIR10399.1 MAG: tRNA (guanosine(37)-N1)-methyltransferase TrmD [Gammaproteobacteria bacterium CG11_big_fil_rev_8_21_14_0_20_46_22]